MENLVVRKELKQEKRLHTDLGGSQVTRFADQRTCDPFVQMTCQKGVVVCVSVW